MHLNISIIATHIRIFSLKNFFFLKVLHPTGVLIFLINYYYLCIYIFIKICKPTTQTQRFKKTTFLLKFKNFIKFFKFFNKNNAGRNNIGGITVFSKGLKKKTTSLPLLKPSLWDKNNRVIVSLIRNKKKLFSINKHITGSVSIHPYIDGTFIGQKTFSSNLPKNFWNNNLPGSVVLVKFLTKFSIFSNIYLNGIKKYAASNGTYCQILDHFYDYNLVKITLPSKKVKIVSGWNYVVLGRNSQVNYHQNRLGKAGINYLLGRKPKVRGVARNPVDHPHGGRTKTNQPEVSIWGWVAKRNK